MRYRYKVLIVLLLTTLATSLLWHMLSHEQLERLSREILRGAKQSAVQRAENSLTFALGSVTNTISLGEKLISAVVQRQAEAASRLLPLSGGQGSSQGAGGHMLPMGSGARGAMNGGHMRPSPRELLTKPRIEPYLGVVWRGFFLPDGDSVIELEQRTTEPNATSPRRTGPRHDARGEAWYEGAKGDGDPGWYTLEKDVVTGQSLAVCSAPILDEAGTFQGVSALAVRYDPVRWIESKGIQVPPGMAFFLVKKPLPSAENASAPKPAEPDHEALEDVEERAEEAAEEAAQDTAPALLPAARTSGLSIVLRGENDDPLLAAQDTLPGQVGEELKSPDLAAFDEMLAHLASGGQGLTRMTYASKDCIWTYGPASTRTATILILPYENVLEPVKEIQEFLDTVFMESTRRMAFFGLGVLLFSSLLALAFARTVTRRLERLAGAMRALAHGDFDVRVQVRGTDEIERMGKAFNALAPQLKAWTQTRQALSVARSIQQNLLPGEPPDLPGVDLAGLSIYSEAMGGDYYDFLVPDETDPETAIDVAVGDVTGHGLEAALLMTTARAFLRQRATKGGDPAAIAADVNAILARDTYGSGRFMTLFYCRVERRGTARVASWVRCGHDPALLYDPVDGSWSELNGEGLPLGVIADATYSHETRELSPGQVLLLATDGLWEARAVAGTQAGKMYGKERLKAVLARHAASPAAVIAAAIEADLRAYVHPLGESSFEDDVTLVVVKIEPLTP